MPNFSAKALLDRLAAGAIEGLVEDETREIFRAASLSARGTARRSAVDRMVFLGLSRRSAGERFKELRRHQVENIGNRPAPSLVHEFLPGLAGCIPIVTCCRFELHGLLAPEDDTPSDEEFLEGFAALLRLPHDALPLLTLRRGKDAVRHLVWTGLGGESVIPGETEIMGQLKSAYQTAQADGHLRRSRELHTVYQRAFHTMRVLRDRHFASGGWSTSIQRLAIDRMRGGLAERGADRPASTWHVGIVGAGQIALQLAAVCLREGVPPHQLNLYVRSPERARSQSAFPRGARAIPLHQLDADLARGALDGLFGAVTHPVERLQRGAIWASLARPCTVVDLSVPPMFDAAPFAESAPRLNYIGFEELMAHQGERLDDVRQRLGDIERLALVEADRLAIYIDRSEALRGLPLEAARRSLRERADSQVAASLGDIDSLIQESAPSAHRAQRRIANVRRKLRAIVRDQALRLLKSTLLDEFTNPSE